QKRWKGLAVSEGTAGGATGGAREIPSAIGIVRLRYRRTKRPARTLATVTPTRAVRMTTVFCTGSGGMTRAALAMTASNTGRYASAFARSVLPTTKMSWLNFGFAK